MRAKPGITAGEWPDGCCDSKRLWGPKGSWKVTPTTHATSLKEKRVWGGERERKVFPSGESLPASSKHHLVKGAFPSQVGVDDEISLGAYVAAALLELGQPLKVSMLPLPPALRYAPTPGHRYGDMSARNAGVLQARNR